METNGIKGRIHCSQSTADALIQGGKSHWVSRREDKIVAKGKGEMQTYWVNTVHNHHRNHHRHHQESHDRDASPSGTLTQKKPNKHEGPVDVEAPATSGRRFDHEHHASNSDLDGSSNSEGSRSKIVKGTIASYCG